MYNFVATCSLLCMMSVWRRLWILLSGPYIHSPQSEKIIITSKLFVDGDEVYGSFKMEAPAREKTFLEIGSLLFICRLITTQNISFFFQVGNSISLKEESQSFYSPVCSLCSHNSYRVRCFQLVTLFGDFNSRPTRAPPVTEDCVGWSVFSFLISF